jgi:predicted nucleotidyltransferase component of viral defense system
MNGAKLKDIISRKSLGNSDSSQVFFQMFYFERILERISISKYRGQIILKGGLLLSSMIGIDERTTRDMDASFKGVSLSEDKVTNIFNEILSIKLEDGVYFEIISVKDIRLEDEYGGYKINILANLDSNKTYVAVELTTGDVITPREINYKYNSMFENKKISIMAYTLETVLAEKFQTVINRGILNTRMKDFYDIHVLINTKIEEINIDNLRLAIKNTFSRRETTFDINEFRLVLNELKESKELNNMWKEYQNKNNYALDINYLNTLNTIEKIIEILEY